MKHTKYFYYISILLLILALLGGLPYGYYTFLKIFIFITALYTLFDKEHTSFFFFCWLFTAILYNPFIKIHLGRDNWEIINLLTVLFIVIYLWKIRHK